MKAFHGILSGLTEEAAQTIVTDFDENHNTFERPMRPIELFERRLAQAVQMEFGPYVEARVYRACGELNPEEGIRVFLVNEEGTIQPPSKEGWKAAYSVATALATEVAGWPGGWDEWANLRFFRVIYEADNGHPNHREAEIPILPTPGEARRLLQAISRIGERA